MSEESCVFCKIIKGKLSSYKIIEDESVLGFLDSNPSAEGHCIIIPKKHIRRWHDLNDDETAIVFNSAKIVAKRIMEVFKPDFVCVFIRGGRVKHVHVVLFPSFEGDKLSGFPQSVLGTKCIDLKKVQEKLKFERK